MVDAKLRCQTELSTGKQQLGPTDPPEISSLLQECVRAHLVFRITFAEALLEDGEDYVSCVLHCEFLRGLTGKTELECRGSSRPFQALQP